MDSDLTRIHLRDFLSRTNVADLPDLPLIHTTESFRITDIMRDQKMLAMPCNVFSGENLCYMFVGRPAYKLKDEYNPQYWQLPVAIVVRLSTTLRAKRIFPFDTGAFHHKLLPTHILGFQLGDFEISEEVQATQKLIATFFGSNENYVKRKPLSRKELEEKHVLGPTHMEIVSLAEMYNQPLTATFDDRVSTIEIQYDQSYAIDQNNLIGIVLPDEYKRWPALMDQFAKLNAKVEFYSIYPLQLSHYYHTIYDLVNKLTKNVRRI